MLLGTLDMLILQTLVLGPSHAHSIAHSIERQSDDILQVEHGSFVPGVVPARRPQLDPVFFRGRPKPIEKQSTTASRRRGENSWRLKPRDGSAF